MQGLSIKYNGQYSYESFITAPHFAFGAAAAAAIVVFLFFLGSFLFLFFFISSALCASCHAIRQFNFSYTHALHNLVRL